MAASGSNLRLSFIDEQTWGVTPANPKMKVLAGVVSESLGGSMDTLTSKALNPNRGVDFMAPGQKKAQGDISYEMGVRGSVGLIGRLLGKIDTVDNTDGTYTHTCTVAKGPIPISIEKWFSDVGLGFVFRGCKANTFSVSGDPNGIINGTIGMMAKGYESTTKPLDPAPESTSHAFYDGIRASVKVGGKTFDMNTISFDVTNNIEDARVIGKDESVALTPGVCEVKGSFAIVYNDNEILQKAVDGVEDKFEVIFYNKTFSASFLFPRIKYSGDPVPKATGPTTVNIELSFTALLDNDPQSPTFNKSIVLTVINDEPKL